MMETIRWDEIAEASTVAPPVKTYRFEMKNGTVIVAVGVDDYDIANDRADALAAKVKRLTADNAALRAQLDAGEGWRVVDDLDITQDVEAEIMMRATYQHKYGTWDARAINILKHDADYWRPAPPQE